MIPKPDKEVSSRPSIRMFFPQREGIVAIGFGTGIDHCDQPGDGCEMALAHLAGTSTRAVVT